MAITFPTLPMEIRFMVYEVFLVRQQRITIETVRGSGRRIIPRSTSEKTVDTELLLVSKQVQYEATRVLYSGNTFCFDPQRSKTRPPSTPADNLACFVASIGSRNASHLCRMYIEYPERRVIFKGEPSMRYHYMVMHFAKFMRRKCGMTQKVSDGGLVDDFPTMPVEMMAAAPSSLLRVEIGLRSRAMSVDDMSKRDEIKVWEIAGDIREGTGGSEIIDCHNRLGKMMRHLGWSVSPSILLPFIYNRFKSGDRMPVFVVEKTDPKTELWQEIREKFFSEVW